MLSLGYLINVSVIKTKVGYPVLTNLINGSWLDILTKDVVCLDDQKQFSVSARLLILIWKMFYTNSLAAQHLP